MPTHADGTLLPAVLALLLALLAGFQLATGGDDPLPETYGRVVMPTVPVRRLVAVAADPVVVRAAVFATVRNKDRAGAPASLGPLGDAVPVGVTRGRGVTHVILQRADSSIVALPVGGQYRGWRVAAVAGDGVRFIGDSGSVTIPLAGRPLATGPSGGPLPGIR